MDRRVRDGVVHPRESPGDLTLRVFIRRIGIDENTMGHEE